MQDQLISFETAKLAKEKGFYKNTNKRYIYRYKEHESANYQAALTKDPLSCDIPAPTQSLLQKWLREKHSILLDSVTGYDCGIRFEIIKNDFDIIEYTDMYKTYEEALEEGLMKALKLIK